jgi:hypothetical protein
MANEQKPKFTVLPNETYLKTITNSIGSRLFNSKIVQYPDGRIADILNNGELSCAFFVSGILKLYDLVPRTRSTVSNFAADLEQNEKFVEITETDLQPGDIIFWGEYLFKDGEPHKHVGFYVGENQAVSTNYSKGEVVKHNHKVLTADDGVARERKIERVFHARQW